jgi:hypothetical protein
MQGECACISYCSSLFSGTITKNYTSRTMGHSHILRFLFISRLATIFIGRWIGRGGPNDHRESSILFNMIYVGEDGPNRQSARPNQQHMTVMDLKNAAVLSRFLMDS